MKFSAGKNVILASTEEIIVVSMEENLYFRFLSYNLHVGVCFPVLYFFLSFTHAF